MAQNMALTKDNQSILAYEIERLRSAMCPDRYPYTHEFLQLATLAAHRESVDDDGQTILNLAQLRITH